MSIPVLILALCFWWLQNSYFGWNARPQSDAELIADGITILLLALALLGSRS